MEYKIPRGTYDILPDQSWKWQKVQSVFREVAAAFGFEEIVTPVFEQSELFERSSGESSDVVQKEMYRFTDRKGRSLALRPEGTAPVVRSYVENHLEQKSWLTKLYYLGPMFRYDRPQAGRYRQFYQYGIELIGSNDPYYDAEVIALQDAFLRRLGLTDIRLEINSVGCPDCNKDYEEALQEYFRPHLPELCPDCQKRFDVKPKRLLDCKVASCKMIAAGAPSQFSYLDAKCSEHFGQVCNFLDLLKVHYTINHKIVRGLDYYTNTAFEFVNDALGAQDTIAGGGRYNGLIAQIGGKETPAIGFAGGFERLLLSLEKAGISLGEGIKPSVFVIAMGEEAVRKAAGITHKIRKSGLCCAFNPVRTKLKNELKAASDAKAPYAIIIGDSELEQGVFILKDLVSGQQIQLPLDDDEALLAALQ